jgi:hypothetical protein
LSVQRHLARFGSRVCLCICVRENVLILYDPIDKGSARIKLETVPNPRYSASIRVPARDIELGARGCAVG